MPILETIAFIIYILAAILMVLAILLQEGKGGGLAGLGGAQAEATFGATNPLRRFTAVMAVAFLFLASFLDYVGKGGEVKVGGKTAVEAAEKSGAKQPGGKSGEGAPPAGGQKATGSIGAPVQPAPAAESEAKTPPTGKPAVKKKNVKPENAGAPSPAKPKGAKGAVGKPGGE